MTFVNRRGILLLSTLLGACAHEGGDRPVGQSGTEGSDLGCTEPTSRRPLSASELADAGTPVLLSTLDGADAEGRFGWLDSVGHRQFTVVHVRVDVDEAAGTQVEWRTVGADAAPCSKTVEYGATMVLRTDDGALDERIAGTVSAKDGLIQFVAALPASSFDGRFAPRSTETVGVMAAWSGEEFGVPGREPRVQLRKLEIVSDAGDTEFAALAAN